MYEYMLFFPSFRLEFLSIIVFFFFLKRIHTTTTIQKNIKHLLISNIFFFNRFQFGFAISFHPHFTCFSLLFCPKTQLWIMNFCDQKPHCQTHYIYLYLIEYSRHIIWFFSVACFTLKIHKIECILTLS